MGIANTLALVRATLDKLRWTVPGVAKIAVTAPSRRPRGAPEVPQAPERRSYGYPRPTSAPPSPRGTPTAIPHPHTPSRRAVRKPTVTISVLRAAMCT